MIDLAELRSQYTPAAAATLAAPAAVALIFVASLVSSVFRYLSWCGGLYWYFYVFKREPLAAKKIQPGWPDVGQIKREIAWSLSSCVVYAVMTAVLYVCLVRGWTRIYLNVSDHGWGYVVFSFVLMLFLHDAYFYFTHRLSHRSRFLFRRFHGVHHRSSNPTPFADIMFHPVDALIHAGFVPLFLFMIPLHPLTIGVFLTMVTVVNALGHIGYEMFPPNRFVSRPTAHNRHHSHPGGNFGLYFTFWDRVLGTDGGRT